MRASLISYNGRDWSRMQVQGSKSRWRWLIYRSFRAWDLHNHCSAIVRACYKCPCPTGMSSRVWRNPPCRGDRSDVTSDSMNEALRTVIYLGCRIIRAHQDIAKVYFKISWRMTLFGNNRHTPAIYSLCFQPNYRPRSYPDA